MKTILHTIDTTGPGGAETVFIDLATRLPKEKYRSVVVIRGKGWVYEELCRRGVKPALMDAKGSFNWRYLLKLANLVRGEGVDLIQSHLLGSNVYCSLAGLLTRIPVVATFHGAVDIRENERLKVLKFGSINRGARNIIAVSDALRRDIIGRTPLKARKTSVIYNGIETADFQRPRSDALRRQYDWSEEDIIIGSLGNIRPAKGYDVLLRAAALLHDTPRGFRFVIAGQGKTGLYDDLLNLRDELGLQNTVQFVGFVNDPADFLSNLDMFLLSSISEGFSIATIQAMAAGLPSIVTRSGGPLEIISHGENGWMLDAGNPAAISEAILTLAADPVLSSRLAKSGREHVAKKFGMNAMLAAYEEIYDQL
ncbi:MAG: glycosyltransferase family 4 protein [Gammaproteobacteria bacterium]